MKSVLTFLVTILASATVLANDHAVKSVDADTSLRWLQNGNARFTNSKLRKDGQSQNDVHRLSTGQQPHAIVLSCSDSRVPPEVVFDQKLGEIFVVRTAGEALGDNAIGSIEYAVEHLGSKLLVVMGHTSCGAVKAAHSSLDGSSLGTPALDNLVKDIHPRISQFKGKTPSKNFATESWANTEGVAKDLLTRSELIRKKVESGDLRIVSSLYDLESGQVAFKAESTLQTRVPASIEEAKKDSHHTHGRSGATCDKCKAQKTAEPSQAPHAEHSH
ncbi:carbonic anhydrase [Bdellovibrio sp. ArHS]|uniref:carbonic anhydrase n=1 Tax=Bdellovibrio sp. ArHS TaxID=1569284 RepID=UPI000AEC0F85|nr:carbonic anhydrase [Bdellovibrio sp. ArHS]